MNAVPAEVLAPRFDGLSPLRARQLADVYGLTRQLAEALQTADWAAAAMAESSRAARLREFFASPPVGAELAAVTRAVRELVRMNDEAIGLAQHRVRAVEREVDTVSHGRSSVLSYLDHVARKG